MSPSTEPAGNGLASPASEQPRLEAFDAAAWAATIGAGPGCVVPDGPRPAGPAARPVRFDGTGVGAVTLTSPGTSVESLLTAPTAMTFGEIAGEFAVDSSGPALPFAKTIVTPASTACSAALTIGSGQASVFW